MTKTLLTFFTILTLVMPTLAGQECHTELLPTMCCPEGASPPGVAYFSSTNTYRLYATIAIGTIVVAAVLIALGNEGGHAHGHKRGHKRNSHHAHGHRHAHVH